MFIITRNRGKRFVHVGDEGSCLEACAIGDSHKGSRQRPRFFRCCHESPGAAFHVQHQMLQSGGEFF
jgi:hypothetical protein